MCPSCLPLFKKKLLHRKGKLIIYRNHPNSIPIKATSKEKLKLTLQSYRIENKTIKPEIARKKALIHKKMFLLIKNLTLIYIALYQMSTRIILHRFNNKNGILYHPAVIRYCLSLNAKSNSAYDGIRYDDKTKSGVLMLLSKRRLRDYKNCIRPERGFNAGVIK